MRTASVFLTVFLLRLELLQELLGTILNQLPLSFDLFLLIVRSLGHWSGTVFLNLGLGAKVEPGSFANPQVRIDIVLAFILR